jgi:predicted dienelactone hydrolase
MRKELIILCTSFLSLITLPVTAAERVIFRVGIFEQTVEVSDLESFAKTGKLSNSLKPYGFLLTPQVQQILSRQLSINPEIADQLVDNLLKKSGGSLLEKFGLAFPESSTEQLKDAVKLALRQTNEINTISLLKAFPEETITIDLTSALGLLLQLNGANIRSQILSPILAQDLDSEVIANPNLTFDPTQTGEKIVSQKTLIFTDQKRKRTIPIDLYYSDHSQPNLVIMSHGLGSDRKFLKYLAEHLASYGLTVVSLEHPGSNKSSFHNGSMLDASEFRDRPQDVSFILDELAKLNRQNQDLQGKLNTEKVTFIGHSFGGYTGLVLGGGVVKIQELRNFCNQVGLLGRSPADWLQCSAIELNSNHLKLQDSRIVQIIALNPLVGNLFGQDGLKNINIPVLIVSSSQDAITPSLDHQLRPFQQLSGKKYLLVAVGATHLSVTDRDTSTIFSDDNGIVREVIGQDAEPLKKAIKGVSLAFIHQLTNQSENYQIFLNGSYVQSLSSERIALRFTQKLPEDLTKWL